VDAVANDIAAAKAYAITSERFQNLIAERTHNRSLTTLRELAEVAVFMASDKTSAMEGTLVNMDLGAIPD
jgi:enoyl-[acyl-carrier-protein] reductase (NADH)